MTTRMRADHLLVQRGLFESRARAQAAIAAGLVRAGGAIVRKPSEPIAADAPLDAVAAHPYASRGGVKLAAALEAFGFDPAGHICLDVGASTGGFTDVLLTRGAARVYAVDVGRDQLHARLRGDPRVVSLEQTDVRALTPGDLAETPDVLVIDVSFISLAHVLPAAERLIGHPAWMVALIKPQFEAERGHTKKGIVRDPAVRQAVCDRVAEAVRARGWKVEGVVPSPITGGDGNVEFLLGARRD